MPNLDPNGLIFSTVDQFVEQVGRRYAWKYADLDNMVCVFNGPSSGALAFKPKVNSRHPQYPLMFCTDSAITNQAALIAEVQATYQGIIQTGGASSYVTPAVTTESSVQGSRDFTLFMTVGTYTGAIFVAPPGGGPAPAQWGTLCDIYTQTETVHYIGTQCSIRYQSYPRPTGLHYSSLGLSRVKWTVMSAYKGQSQQVASGVAQGSAYFQQLVSQYLVHPPPLFAANLGFNIQQRGMWYDCTEEYGPTF